MSNAITTSLRSFFSPPHTPETKKNSSPIEKSPSVDKIPVNLTSQLCTDLYHQILSDDNKSEVKKQSLYTLIDIAMFKDASKSGENHSGQALDFLQKLYINHDISNELRDKLAEHSCDNMLSLQTIPQNQNDFFMPASLLQLSAQHMGSKADNKYDAQTMETFGTEIKKQLDPNDQESPLNLINPQRLISDNEINAAFKPIIKSTENTLICFSDNQFINDELKPEESLNNLLKRADAAPNGKAFSPIFMNNHYFLLLVQKEKNQEGYHFSVIDSNLDTADFQHKNDAIYQHLSHYIAPSSIQSFQLYGGKLQDNVPNSCGALVTLLAVELSKNPNANWQEAVPEQISLWNQTSPEQQKNLIHLERARIIERAIEDNKIKSTAVKISEAFSDSSYTRHIKNLENKNNESIAKNALKQALFTSLTQVTDDLITIKTGIVRGDHIYTLQTKINHNFQQVTENKEKLNQYNDTAYQEIYLDTKKKVSEMNQAMNKIRQEDDAQKAKNGNSTTTLSDNAVPPLRNANISRWQKIINFFAFWR